MDKEGYFNTDEGEFKYDGSAPCYVNINGESVKVLPNQTITIIDDKGGYEITDTISPKNIEITDATFKVK